MICDLSSVLEAPLFNVKRLTGPLLSGPQEPSLRLSSSRYRARNLAKFGFQRATMGLLPLSL